jgi:hypothetical protein
MTKFTFILDIFKNDNENVVQNSGPQFVAEIWASDDAFGPPLLSMSGETADGAVRNLFNNLSFDLDDDENSTWETLS